MAIIRERAGKAVKKQPEAALATVCNGNIVLRQSPAKLFGQ